MNLAHLGDQYKNEPKEWITLEEKIAKENDQFI